MEEALMGTTNATQDEGFWHTVEENECILSIANANGFFWKTLWDHPNNQDLRRVRGDPNVLLPEDRVFVPEFRIVNRAGGTEQRHRFRKKGTPSLFRVRLFEHGEAQSDVPYVLALNGILYEGKSDEDGFIEVAVPPQAQRGTLTLGEAEAGETMQVAVGGLDPTDDMQGARQRLRNLGYDCGEDDEQLQAAIGSFQLENQLPVTKQLDEATRDTLRKIHGC